MQTQDQGYSENTQITKSGRKLKFGLLFVGDDVPSDQLEDYEVALTEDGLGLRKIQVNSNKELYGEVLEIIRWAHQEFLKKRKENNKTTVSVTEMDDFLNQNNLQMKQDQLLNFSQILALKIYQCYGQKNIDNFKECISYLFSQKNQNYLFEFVKYLHQKKKLKKILSIIPQVTRKQAFEEHEKKQQEAIKRQEHFLKNQTIDKQIIIENREKHKCISFNEQFQKFLAETSSNSSNEVSPQNQSPNRIYSQIDSQIAKTNFATQKKLSAKEQIIQRLENNNFNTILQYNQYQNLQNNAQTKRTVAKVSFDKEIIKKDEIKLQMQEKENLKQRHQQDEKQQQQIFFLQNLNQFQIQYEQSYIQANEAATLSKQRSVIQQNQNYQQINQTLYQNKLVIPKFCGEPFSCHLRNNHTNKQDESQEIYTSNKKYNNFKEQQLTSINQRQRVCQSQSQETEAKQIHPSITRHFNEVSKDFRQSHEKLHERNQKNQIEQVSKSKYLTHNKILDFQLQNQKDNLNFSNNHLNFFQTDQFVQKKQPQNTSNLGNRDDDFLQPKNQKFFNDSHFMSLQQCNFAIQKQNPFKSMQKSQFKSRESSLETTQNSSKASLSLNRVHSQLKIGDKVQKCGKIFVFSQNQKQQNSLIIEDDIVEVEKM